ncbi:MAG: acyl--CoA ligase, partial [Chlorobiaceae bacterium]|nr:acyl--CoA ligase [Chlorobiaceae bacterium]
MDIISRAAQLFGNAAALRIAEHNLSPTLSFIECDKQAQCIANTLYRSGLRAGDTVAIVSPNTAEAVLLLLGLLKAGMIAAPLNYRFPEHLISSTLEKLRPSLILTT